MDSPGFSCSGVQLKPGGGTWKGHVIPGLWFLGWGLYWAQASFRRHIKSQHSGRQYSSRPWYPMVLAGGWLYAAEPFLKSIAAPIGLSIELYFDSKDGFRSLYCNDTGRFSQQYIHNYQHASSYPGFTLSGIVDLLGMFMPLPAGAEQVFLALSFGVEGFLMLIHKKHLALDAMVHMILGGTMVSGAAAIVLELGRPNSFPLSALRAFCLVMQGVWMIAMGEILFTDSKSWNDDYMGPAMMAPPLFCMLLLLSGFCLLMMYCCMDWWHRRQLSYQALPQTLTKPEKEEVHQESRQYDVFSIDDSANETSDDGSEHSESHSKPEKTRHQLQTAFNKLKPASRQILKSPPKSSEHMI